MHKTCSFYKPALKTIVICIVCPWTDGTKKKHYFQGFFVSFSYLFFLFYFISSFIPRFILPHAKMFTLFQKVNLSKLLFFHSTYLFRHLDLSLSLFRPCSQISDKNSMTVSLLPKWTSTSASTG